MGISPDMEAWKARFAICLLIALSALLLTGAREVTREWVRYDSHLATVKQEALNWVIPAPPTSSQATPTLEHQTPQPPRKIGATWVRPTTPPAVNPTRDSLRQQDTTDRSPLADYALFLAEACARPVHNP